MATCIDVEGMRHDSVGHLTWLAKRSMVSAGAGAWLKDTSRVHQRHVCHHLVGLSLLLIAFEMNKCLPTNAAISPTQSVEGWEERPAHSQLGPTTAGLCQTCSSQADDAWARWKAGPDLLLVLLELQCCCLLQCTSQATDGVVMGPSLQHQTV